jgi:hypothetical protein
MVARSITSRKEAFDSTLSLKKSFDIYWHEHIFKIKRRIYARTSTTYRAGSL